MSTNSFIDRAKVEVRAGSGGNGMVAFRREKFVPRGGPAGGDGGRGGDVIFEVDEGLHTLLDFRYNRHFRAKNGQDGMSKGKYGRGAEDLIVKVPPGTIVKRLDTGVVIADLVEHGQQVVVAKGGRGGRGNIRFASAKNPAPQIAENGEPGEEFEVSLELKVIADVGLLGFPSVGKSTLLSVISNAKPEIADYPFTTLQPNLGMVRMGYGEDFVVADLPGLIEGASEGVGLGLDFLKHVERTKVLLHVIDMAATHKRDPFNDFVVLQNELKAYNERLLLRPMLIVANKMDLPEASDNLVEFKKQLEKYYEDLGQDVPEIVEISAYQSKGIKELLDKTYNYVQNAEFISLEEEISTEHTYRLEEETEPFVIEKVEDGFYLVTGEEIERLVKMTNFQFEESIQRFTRQIRHMGIEDELREAGCVAGDIVQVVDFQFEFTE